MLADGDTTDPSARWNPRLGFPLGDHLFGVLGRAALVYRPGLPALTALFGTGHPPADRRIEWGLSLMEHVKMPAGVADCGAVDLPVEEDHHQARRLRSHDFNRCDG